MVSEQDRKFAVVTGAASGLGFALARECAAHGCDVMICAADERISVAAAWLANERGWVQAVRADLATYAGVEQLFAAIRATGRPLDAALLVADAGFAALPELRGPFTATSLDAELELLRTACVHVVHLVKLVLPELVAGGGGALVLADEAAAQPPVHATPFAAVRGATSAFTSSFADALRGELADTGIDVLVAGADAEPAAIVRAALAATAQITRPPMSREATPAVPDALRETLH